MPTVEPNLRSLISPLGIVRFFEIFLSCTAFSLTAVYSTNFTGDYGAWCMFTWCFCFIISIIIVLLELIGLAQSLPISWQDFTSAFSMLAALMIFTTSIVYPSVFVKGSCHGKHCSYPPAATAMSCLCFIAYAVEVGLTRAKFGDISSFLATIPGLMKVFEAYVACLIFSLVHVAFDASYPGMQWCLAVYCICFIITLLIVILTIGRCLASLPIPLEKTLLAYTLLAVLMYLTAAVVWPVYGFRESKRTICRSPSDSCPAWNNRIGITFLTIVNFIAYLVDLGFSSKMVFVTSPA